jgi:putative addiction module component (TIGR02574 family)
MTQLAQKIVEEASKLSPLDRAEIIERIMESFGGEHDDVIEKAWIKEAEARYSQYVSGRVDGVPADTVFNKIKNGTF